MKRLLLMLSLVVGLASTALAKTYTATTSSGCFTDNKWEAGIATWSTTVKAQNADGSYYTGYDGTKGYQFGSGSKPVATVVLETGNIPGTITSVKVNAATASSGNATLSVKVGDTAFTPESSKLATTSADYSFSGSAEGVISITYTNNAKKAVYLKSITVEYEETVGGNEVPEMPVVSFGDVTAENNGKYEVVEGTEVSVTSAGADYLLVTNTTGLTKERIEGNTYSFAVNADDTWEFTGGNGTGSSETFKVTFTAVPAPKTGGVVYTRVKSASELVAGETYTIACAEVNKAMSNASQEKYRQIVDVNIVKGSFEATNDVLAFTLEKNSDKWNIATLNYAGTDGYFNLSSSAADFKITDTATGYDVTIDENSNVNIASGSRTIKYNSGSPRFAMYLSSFSQGEAVQLYREEVVAPGIYFNGEQLEAGASPELKAGDKIVIRGHEANELHYKLLNSAMRAPSANLDGWHMNDSNVFEYEVPEGFENMSISLAAKAVNNGKESAPVQFVVSEGTMTGVAGVEAEAAEAQTEWFTLQGVRVAAPAEGGLYIRRQGSKVEKVVL